MLNNIIIKDNQSGDGGTNKENNVTGFPGNGGGILNNGLMEINNSLIINNIRGEGSYHRNLEPHSIPSHGGGGIYNHGRLLISDSDILDNNAKQGGSGGGIFNDLILHITNSSISGNEADAGGGIFSQYSAHGDYYLSDQIDGYDVTLVGTRVEHNQTYGPGGGGVYNESAMHILGQSIISHNSTDNPARYSGNGGGILNYGYLVTDNSFIRGNRTGGTAGGGIYNGDSLIIRNSVVANNSTAKETLNNMQQIDPIPDPVVLLLKGHPPIRGSVVWGERSSIRVE